MMPLDYVLAVAVLTAPPGETSYFLRRKDHFETDAGLMQKRYRRLAKAAFVCDADRLPHKDVVHELLAFNRAYPQHLVARCEAGGAKNAAAAEAVTEVER